MKNVTNNGLNKFPVILRYLREQHNLSLDELASAIGVSKNTLFRYENGIRQPTLDVLIRISDYFNVSLDFLVGKNNNVGNQEAAYSYIDLTCMPKKARDSLIEFYDFVMKKYGGQSHEDE